MSEKHGIVEMKEYLIISINYHYKLQLISLLAFTLFGARFKIQCALIFVDFDKSC